jgi:hypothetical protein
MIIRVYNCTSQSNKPIFFLKKKRANIAVYAVLYLQCKYLRNKGFVFAPNQLMLVRYEHVQRT